MLLYFVKKKYFSEGFEPNFRFFTFTGAPGGAPVNSAPPRGHPARKSPVINFENASFSWNTTLQDQLCPMLTNLNLKINRGELVCIIGSVGSGKSSLISAMMGEMDKIVGSLKTFGKRSYCPQQAWILNMTIRKNVLFESEYEKSWYDKVVEACQLSQDFKQLGGCRSE